MKGLVCHSFQPLFQLLDIVGRDFFLRARARGVARRRRRARSRLTGLPMREGFEGDAAEGFGVGGAGDNDIGDRHDLAQVAAVADEGDVVFESGGLNRGFYFSKELQLFWVGLAD